MARPKKGTPAGDKATEKWHKTMEAKHGGKEGVTNLMQQIGAKGGKAGCGPDYFGGFVGDRERAKRCGAIGGAKSRRGPSDYTKIVLEKRKEDIQSMLLQGVAIKDIAKELGIAYSTLYNHVKKGAFNV